MASIMFTLPRRLEGYTGYEQTARTEKGVWGTLLPRPHLTLCPCVLQQGQSCHSDFYLHFKPFSNMSALHFASLFSEKAVINQT